MYISLKKKNRNSSFENVKVKKKNNKVDFY